ncbi:hypothetical protein D0T66_05330 [Dysgonomonas sp. 25]|nr:hypothetical protein [Dysgonomonas sp. 25]
MKNSYNYKRVGVRKIAIVLFVVAILLVVLSVVTMMQSGTTNAIPSLMAVLCATVLLYTSFRKTKVIVEDDQFEIVDKTIRIDQIKRIDIQDKRIDVVVENGVFILGSHLYMTDKCFDSLEDWNSFKKDMENLKTKLL